MLIALPNSFESITIEDIILNDEISVICKLQTFLLQPFTIIFLKIVLLLIPSMVAIAYLTLVERKLLAAIQRREGPNRSGLWGLLQPLYDGGKLFLKETIIGIQAHKFLFILAPIMTFGLSFAGWLTIPFCYENSMANLKFPIIFFLAFSSLGVYGVIIAGWASNTKYAFLGALRSTSQMISYEVSIGLIFLNLIVNTSSFNFKDIVKGQLTFWYIMPFFVISILFFISILAETNRAPFDLPEAEAELVAGYNVEYSGMGFALFFLGEYGHMIMMSVLMSVLFFGGWEQFGIVHYSNLIFKAPLGLIWFILIRGAFPRFRYDQLMRFGWKISLPLSLGHLVCVCCVSSLFDLFFQPYLIKIHFQDWIENYWGIHTSYSIPSVKSL